MLGKFMGDILADHTTLAVWTLIIINVENFKR
jgi:hypothetical protein